MDWSELTIKIASDNKELVELLNDKKLNEARETIKRIRKNAGMLEDIIQDQQTEISR